MKLTDCVGGCSFEAFSLQGVHLGTGEWSVARRVFSLVGMSLAFVFSLLAVLSTQSLAQDALKIVAIDDVVAGDEGWIIAIDDVAVDAGGWITAIDDVVAGTGDGIAAYAAEAGGGFAAFGDVAAETGGGIAAFGRVEYEISEVIGRVFDENGRELFLEDLSILKIKTLVANKPEQRTIDSSSDDDTSTVAEDPSDKPEGGTRIVGDDAVITVAVATTDITQRRSCRVFVARFNYFCLPFGDSVSIGPVTLSSVINGEYREFSSPYYMSTSRNADKSKIDTAVISTSGNVSGENVGIYGYKNNNGHINLANDADIDGVRYGIQFIREGEGELDIVNTGRIMNAEYGIHARHVGAEGDLRIRVKNRESRLTEIISERDGVFAQRDGGGEIAIYVESGVKVVSREGSAVFAEHNGKDDLKSEDINILVKGEVRGGQNGVSVVHDDDGFVDIWVARGAEVHGDLGGIRVDRNDNTNGYRVKIDVAGKVSSTTGDAIYMNGNTLILRPGFSLDGAVVSDGRGETTLRLRDPGSSGDFFRGVLDLSEDEFRGFDVFSGDGLWLVTGEASEDEAFLRADIGGSLRFSDVNFKMAKISSQAVYVANVGRMKRDVHGTFEVGGRLELAGNNHLRGDFENDDGRLVFDPKGSLATTGNYYGWGDMIFNVDLANRNAGKLTVGGDVEGSSHVSMNVTDALEGSVLVETPVLVEVRGYARAGSFVGEETIGAFDYVLEHETVGRVLPVPFDELGRYRGREASRNIPRDGSFGFHTWRFRQDGLSASTAPLSVIVTVASDLILAGMDEDENAEGGAWARQPASFVLLEPNVITGSRSRTKDNRFHFGFDIPAVDFMGGDMIVGASMWQGGSISDVSSHFGNGGIDVESYAAAMKASWQSPDGFYVDGRFQYVRLSSDISAEGLSLVQDNEGIGMSTLAETGYHFTFPFGGMGFRLSPQMELLWSRVGFDDFVGPHNELVSLEDGDLVSGRLGLSWGGEWRNARGSGHVYGEMSLRRALDGKTAVNVSGFSLVSEQEGLSIDGRLGVSYEWDEAYVVQGEVIAQRRDEAEEVRANLGMRIVF